MSCIRCAAPMLSGNLCSSCSTSMIAELKDENAALRTALMDIEAGRGDALIEEGDLTTRSALMRRAGRALSSLDSEDK